MALRQREDKEKALAPRARLTQLESCDPLAASIGILYAYDMTLSMEAGVKEAGSILAGYRKAMEEKYPLESDRKAAGEAARKQLEALAGGKDPLQSAAARALLEAWDSA